MRATSERDLNHYIFHLFVFNKSEDDGKLQKSHRRRYRTRVPLGPRLAVSKVRQPSPAAATRISARSRNAAVRGRPGIASLSLSRECSRFVLNNVDLRGLHELNQTTSSRLFTT